MCILVTVIQATLFFPFTDLSAEHNSYFLTISGCKLSLGDSVELTEPQNSRVRPPSSQAPCCYPKSSAKFSDDDTIVFSLCFGYFFKIFLPYLEHRKHCIRIGLNFTWLFW